MGALRVNTCAHRQRCTFTPPERCIFSPPLTESSINGLDQSADLTAYSSFTVSPDWRISLYALTGLTDNAPDFGAGLRLTWRADFRRPTED